MCSAFSFSSLSSSETIFASSLAFLPHRRVPLSEPFLNVSDLLKLMLQDCYQLIEYFHYGHFQSSGNTYMGMDLSHGASININWGDFQESDVIFRDKTA